MKLLILFTTIPLSLLLLLLPIASPHDHHPTLHTTSHIQPTTTTSSAMAAAYHCSSTPYPSLCISTLTSTIPNLPSKTLPQIITSSINHTATSVHSSASATAALLRSRLPSLEPLQRIALSDCLDLFDQTISDFNRAVVDLTKHPTSTGDDLKTVLSAAMTNQFTCLDGFAYVNDAESLRPLIEDRLFSISQLVGNSLALSKKIPTAKKKIGEVFEEYGSVVKGFPKWISDKDQNLLHGNVTVADLVVAKDGSGNFTTITEAVDAAPNSSDTRFLIYIKAGAYFENVEVGKKKTNLIFVGDGIGKTVVKASRNVVDGWTTYRSATLAVVGNGFLARDITIENEAGPSKHQAVALRNGADLSAFYRCSFVGYQDTLYVHSMRQFFRECDIYGTVDFIFGNAAVVLQNCNLYARKPDPYQKNIYTAQGREDPNQNTGISIQNCKVAAASDLIPVQSEFKTYLGRPWKAYSRTVVLESYLGSLIEPEGWLEWDGNFALDTLYYGEYKNHGPGSNTTARVNWAGYRVINRTEANRFTVENFIDGDEWLASTSVPFTAGLV